MSVSTVPWVEKYRPVKLGEMVLSESTRRLIAAQLHPHNHTHLIIQGRPGIGKTSTARCLASEILGERRNVAYLEINAADERGTKNITTNVEPFCRRMISDIPYKIVVLDEADNLTDKSQTDLVDVISRYMGKVRFFLLCNNSEKVAESLQSICQIIQYQPLDLEGSIRYLEGICQSENLTYSLKGLELIAQIGSGDMRKNINNLQKIAFAHSTVTSKAILDVCHYPDPEEIHVLIRRALKRDLIGMLTVFGEVRQKGYYYLDVISSVEHCLIYGRINPEAQSNMLTELYRLRLNLREACSFNLQFSAMLCKIASQD